MASGCTKQASGAHARKQGQRLWQLNYRMKLNAYNRIAFSDAHRKGTMQSTHAGLEFVAFSDSVRSVSILSAPPQAVQRVEPQGTHGPLGLGPFPWSSPLLTITGPCCQTAITSHHFPQKSDMKIQMGPFILLILTPTFGRIWKVAHIYEFN